MRIIVSFLISTFYLYGVSLTLNVGQEKGEKYGVLHLRDSEPILCESKDEPYNKKLYLCVFDGDLNNKLKPKKTPYVDISFVTKGKKFYIYIKPKHYSKLLNMDDKLYQSQSTPFPNKQMAKHWSILLYKNMPFSKKKANKEGINFPITYPEDSFPYVGALDLNGKPIEYAQSEDIRLYMDMKKSYKQEYFDEVLQTAKRIKKNYPHTIFMSDVILYELKAKDKLLETAPDTSSFSYDAIDIAKAGKAWLKAYPTDKNTPEIMMIMVKEYIKAYAKNDANYYLDLLISEYPKDPYTQKAILYYADYLYRAKKVPDAIKLYEDVLYSSKDLDVASTAAIKLAKTSLEKGQVEKAKEYLSKVLQANKDFIYKDTATAYLLASKLAHKGLPDIASQIIDVLMESAKRDDDDYEAKLRDAGLWNEEAKNINKAYTYLKRYQKEFRDGDYSILVQKALDRLFFELKETNESKLVKYYDELIKRYDNEIKTKALEAKAKIFIKHKMYDKVLDEIAPMDRNDTELAKTISKAAVLSINANIKKDKCLRVVEVLSKYKSSLNEVSDLPALYRCLMRTSRFNEAELLAQKKMKTDNLVQKLPWMLRLENAFYAQGKYRKCVNVARDIESLGEVLDSKQSIEGYYDRFYCLYKLKNYDEALEVALKLEEQDGANFKNVEIYAKMMEIAKERGNDMMLISYAKKALELEKKANSYVLSPKLEYDYINALQHLKRFKQAKDVSLSLLDRKLDEKQRGRALYVIGESYAKLDDANKSKEYFKKCMDYDKKSSWGKLCKENLSLFGDGNTSK